MPQSGGRIPEVRSQPPLHFLDSRILAARRILDLVARDAADREVPRLRMTEVDAADARTGHHRVRLGERDAERLGAEQVEELALLGVVGARGVAERRPDAAEVLGAQVVLR